MILSVTWVEVSAESYPFSDILGIERTESCVVDNKGGGNLRRYR
jgi:hypothetical protein